VVSVDLRALSHIGEGNCYRVAGDVTFHGTTVELDGMVTVTVSKRGQSSKAVQGAGRQIVVAGEHMLDIRRFGLDVPAMGPFKIYPEVRLHLHMEAGEELD